MMTQCAQSALPPLPAGGSDVTAGTGRSLLGVERVAVNTSRQGTRVLTVLDEHRAIHDGVGNALRLLADTPAIVGEVVYDIFRQWLHCIGVKLW
jgi:hypothetical protein